MIGELRVKIIIEERISFQEIPAKKIISKPDRAIMIDVPKSGWSKTRYTGKKSKKQQLNVSILKFYFDSFGKAMQSLMAV